MATKKPAVTNRRRKQVPHFNIKGWFRHHFICSKQSLMGLIKQPISSALTWLVLAIALLLPTLFYIALKAVDEQTQAWQEGGQITLYLTDQTKPDDGEALALDIAERPEVIRTQYTSKNDAWIDFQGVLNLQSNLTLNENPLPASITIIPEQQSMADLEALILTLQDLPEVEDIQIDLAWIERLNHLIDLLRTAVEVLAGILTVAVLLIVGNTIRLAIESRKSEIQIIKLLGATDAYVRRPFIYLGFWYGILGGLAAWGLLTLISINFQTKLSTFLEHYGLSAPGLWLDVKELVLLLVTSIAVSIAGARIALWRHLRDSDPQ